MKKFLLCLVFLLLLSFSLCACADAEDDGKTDILCSVFPLYDWTREIVGEDDTLSLELLLENGVDMHSYQPSVQDIVKISECDVFIYVGGASDAWIEEVLREHRNPDRTVLRLIDYIDCEDNACHDGLDHSHHHEAEGYDEHIWLSLRNAARLSGVIADALCARLPEKATLYKANAQAYIARINALDETYAEAFGALSQRVLLFADRFPFVYLSRDYGITSFAAFSGCSAESEASAATVRTLSEKLNEYSLHTVLVLEDSADSIAASVISAAKRDDVAVRSLDSMQSISHKDIAGGVRYLSLMEKNLATMLQAMQ